MMRNVSSIRRTMSSGLVAASVLASSAPNLVLAQEQIQNNEGRTGYGAASTSVETAPMSQSAPNSPPQLDPETPQYAQPAPSAPQYSPPQYAPPQQYQPQEQEREGYAGQTNWQQQPQYPVPGGNFTTSYPMPAYVGPAAQYNGNNNYYRQPYQQPPQRVLPPMQGGVSYAPQGLTIPISLRTAISTQVAKPGDYIEAAIANNVSLGGYSYIPAGSVVSGHITESQAGRRLSRSGSLDIQFDDIRLPNGQQIPISAHLVNGIGKYKEGKDDEYHGEGWKAKLGQFALRAGLGAGLLAGLGTGIGAIGGGAYGAGAGAWSGAAIGGGLGGLDMFLRKGRDVIIPSGTQMQLQLDEPISIPTNELRQGAM